jgi:hypothetical protein
MSFFFDTRYLGILVIIKGEQEFHFGFFFLPVAFGVYAVGGNKLFDKFKQ